ncbi:MAG: hypothetical protein LBL59_03355 [Xanthomonadaceae bacterium]|jgi:hypothetical protein|nr:hypothetical protein [Xanthomonadaceae bacterium]
MLMLTLSELMATGIQVQHVHGKLRLSAPPGVLTDELHQRIAQNKTALLVELSQASRARLSALVDTNALPGAPILALSDEDALACYGHTDDVLRAYLHAEASHEAMSRGIPPVAWGELAERFCEGCGPVLLWATCPPVVKACPWCWNRQEGKPVARPGSYRGGR